MRPVDAIIFDMDGVIVDSEPWHEHAFREIFHELGYGENHGIDFQAYIGRSDRVLWLDFIAKHDPPHPIEDLLTAKQDRLIQILRATDLRGPAGTRRTARPPLPARRGVGLESPRHRRGAGHEAAPALLSRGRQHPGRGPHPSPPPTSSSTQPGCSVFRPTAAPSSRIPRPA